MAKNIVDDQLVTHKIIGKMTKQLEKAKILMNKKNKFELILRKQAGVYK